TGRNPKPKPHPAADLTVLIFRRISRSDAIRRPYDGAGAEGVGVLARVRLSHLPRRKWHGRDVDGRRVLWRRRFSWLSVHRGRVCWVFLSWLFNSPVDLFPAIKIPDLDAAA